MKLAIDTAATLQMGDPTMDRTHGEFVDLLNRLNSADKSTFMALFAELLEHTENHFAAENSRMQESGFPAIREHRDEHQRVLGEMTHFAHKVATGSWQLGRAYVRDSLPAWFRLHLLTMDSALAAHLRNCQANPPGQETPP